MAAQPAAARRGLHRGQQVEHRHADGGEVGVLGQDLRAYPVLLPHQAEQDVLGADVVVVQFEGLAERQLEGLLRPRGERDVPLHRPVPGTDNGCDLSPGSAE